MVSLALIRTIVGIVGNIISLGLFLSPMPTFITIFKRKDVEQFSAFPYLATLLNCLLWCLYGLPIVHPDSTLVLTINGAGVVIELCYIIIYTIYSPAKQKLRAILVVIFEIAIVAILGALIITLVHNENLRSRIIGIICIIFCIIMYVAPLAAMVRMYLIRLHSYIADIEQLRASSTCLSIYQSFLNGTCWTIYSLLKFDINILVPNGIGLVFAIGQLILYAMYYKSTQRILEARKKGGEVDLTNVVVRGDPNRVGNAA
ncbi:bidirectional sugar transporter SWEET4-like [Asparagus officinalis]|uniref:bidirectional sugar transporter SWEET4-like n=1 Tax=Asparagus officinalis TaxID=4686 RepID=UPI00098E005A|nr:bidirectional sugar transporter SWEET4-like [Asparagus officinalis]